MHSIKLSLFYLCYIVSEFSWMIYQLLKWATVPSEFIHTLLLLHLTVAKLFSKEENVHLHTITYNKKVKTNFIL